MKKFKNKVVFITGSSKGIGKATATELLRRGAKVVLNGRNAETLARTAQELDRIVEESEKLSPEIDPNKAESRRAGQQPGQVAQLNRNTIDKITEKEKGRTSEGGDITGSREIKNGQASENGGIPDSRGGEIPDAPQIMQIAGDMSDPEYFEQAINAILDRFGRLDILILNAGLSSYGTVEKTGDQTLYNVMKANTLGPFTGARIALPAYTKDQREHCLHLLPGRTPWHTALIGIYSMSKMALTALAQSLKTELTGQGIHIGILYIGFTQNDPQKMAVGPDGRIRPIQSRPGWVQQSPQKVARLILRNISRRRFRSTLSTMGKTMAFFSRYFPRLFQFYMRGMLKQAEKLTAD